jgi:hypothetical protein
MRFSSTGFYEANTRIAGLGQDTHDELMSGIDSALPIDAKERPKAFATEKLANKHFGGNRFSSLGASISQVQYWRTHAR